jgi:hypothetical protein
MHLLGRFRRAHDALFGLLKNGALMIAFHIVRMAEIYERHVVLTLDSDFSVYRKHDRVPLALIHSANG